MQSKYTLLLFLVALLAFSAGCGSDSELCRNADACASRCVEECGDRGVAFIACTGNACNCRCGDSGAGGGGGTAGTGGMGGIGGMGE